MASSVDKDFLVSVVVPLFNKEHVISRTIASIEAQTYQNIEIIIVNDGSTDGSVDVVKRLAKKNKKIRYVSQKNKGPGAARNAGLKIANGVFVSFLDADDEYMPSFLDVAINTFSNDKSINVFAASHYRTSQGDKKDFSPYFEYLGVTQGRFKTLPTIDRYSLLALLWFHHSSTVVCKTEVVRKYGGFYDQTKCLYGEDSYLWLQVIANEVGYCELNPLGWYHVEDSGLCAAGKISLQIPIFLSYPEQIRKTCPESLLPKVEEMFIIYSLFEMFRVFDICEENLFELSRKKSSTIELLNENHTTYLYENILSYAKRLTAEYKSEELMRIVAGPKEGRPWG